MAGIYIHIPFCRQACHYCDFHFSTNLSAVEEMVLAICTELEARKSYLDEAIQTVYLGGGTPSLLSAQQLQRILHTVEKHYPLGPDPEITMEANPEDLSRDKLDELKRTAINRLSIGIQTFSDQHLAWMNRIHDSSQAADSFHEARQSGFKNISLDLIYAIPKAIKTRWQEDLMHAVKLNPEHISLYGLTIEERTVFGVQKKKGHFEEVDEALAATQYLEAIDYLQQQGYQQYEVSNFAKPGYESKHNGAYWAGVKYLGIGPGAHSFNQLSRRFNIKNNARYMRAISNKKTYWEEEQLSKIQRMNEYLLTQLRTKKGVDTSRFEALFETVLLDHIKNTVENMVKEKLMTWTPTGFSLTSHGFLVADEIALKLFFDE